MLTDPDHQSDTESKQLYACPYKMLKLEMDISDKIDLIFFFYS